MTHTIPIRIYYEDTDAGGVVYHANHIKFCERARTEYIRRCGLENSALTDSHNIIFVVRHLEADYLKTAALDDLLEVSTEITDWKNSSFIMKHIVSRGAEVIFEANVTLVCIDKNTKKPLRVPQDIKDKLTHA